MSRYSQHSAILGFAVAFGVFTLAYALSPSFGGEMNMSSNLQDALVPRLASKSRVFHVGESGTVWLEYYNPTGHDISFQPPSEVSSHVEFEGDKGFVSLLTRLNWEESIYTLKPGRSFRVYTEAFTASRIGTMMVVIDGLQMTIDVLPTQ